jgi:biotin transporter BioY
MLGTFGFLLFFLWASAWIIGVIQVAKRHDLSGTQKGIWIAIFVMMPVVGLLIYFAVGRPTN